MREAGEGGRERYGENEGSGRSHLLIRVALAPEGIEHRQLALEVGDLDRVPR